MKRSVSPASGCALQDLDVQALIRLALECDNVIGELRASRDPEGQEQIDGLVRYRDRIASELTGLPFRPSVATSTGRRGREVLA
jgi:hypothetical protein